MTVENNCVIVIPTLTDWFKTLFGFSTNEKQNQDQSQLLESGDFQRALSKPQVITRKLFAPVVIGLSNYFGITFVTVI